MQVDFARGADRQGLATHIPYFFLNFYDDQDQGLTELELLPYVQREGLNARGAGTNAGAGSIWPSDAKKSESRETADVFITMCLIEDLTLMEYGD
ncbi:MAG: hypothetical protein LBB82_08330 [Treponema sp.]|jgi:hypothetical protein|nr:hypothetical protein [Treponema sp.]